MIPEFCYKGMYDEKHRAVTFSPTDPGRTRFAQKGIRSRLLCDACEALLNDRYEKPFHRYWIQGNALGILDNSKVGILKDIDYPTFKLFHLSVLFRASSSLDPNLAEVCLLPSHYDILRQMILTGDAGKPCQFPIMASAISGEDDRIWRDFIGPAHSVRLDGHWGYYFTFCGCQWTYITSSHSMGEFEGIVLKPDGTLPIATFPLKAVELYRDMMAAQRRLVQRTNGAR